MQNYLESNHDVILSGIEKGEDFIINEPYI